MAVDAAGLAAALGIAVAKPSAPFLGQPVPKGQPADDDPGIVEAGRLLSIAGALVTAYLHDDPDDTDCPVEIRDEAIIRTAGHVQNRRTFGQQEGRLKTFSVQFDLHSRRRDPLSVRAAPGRCWRLS